ncbi:MAG: hypothetical protein U0073_13095 [Bacteroidia bacterium]
MQNNKTPQKVSDSPELKVINLHPNHAQIEVEIDRHVKSIQSLIARLTPSDRQKYYNGLLNHLLSEPVQAPLKVQKSKQKNQDHDYSNLTENDLQLIREMSVQMEKLYRISGFDQE